MTQNEPRDDLRRKRRKGDVFLLTLFSSLLILGLIARPLKWHDKITNITTLHPSCRTKYLNARGNLCLNLKPLVYWSTKLPCSLSLRLLITLMLWAQSVAVCGWRELQNVVTVGGGDEPSYNSQRGAVWDEQGSKFSGLLCERKTKLSNYVISWDTTQN